MSQFASEGQVIAGHEYTKQAIYDKNDIDIAYKVATLKEKDGSVSAANGRATPREWYQRRVIDVTYNAANVKTISMYSKIQTMMHESFIHETYFAGDAMDDRSFNYSNVPGTFSGNPHHYKTRESNSMFSTQGYKLMLKMNKIYKAHKNSNGVWNDMWNFAH